MKKRIIQSLLAIACCVTVALSAIPTAEAAMRASVVTGKVTLNGQVIDNKTAKYPLLIYSNITYFPMTYHLSRFMGVSADWNNGSKTLDITAGGARTAYAAETGKKQSGSVSVTLPSYKISVNGAQINNKEEKYPIFNYNGITYFPLTWAYAVDSFGWSYQWDAENGLRIDTTTAPARLPTDPDTGNAALDKASTDNERCAYLVRDDGGRSWVMVQVAGLIARRIVCRVEEGDTLARGERYGMIRFGSRVDLYLPPDYSAVVANGDVVAAGESILARKFQA